MSSSSPGKAFQGRGNIDNEHGVWRDSAIRLQVTCLVHMLTYTHGWPVRVQRRNLVFILDGAGRWLQQASRFVTRWMDGWMDGNVTHDIYLGICITGIVDTRMKTWRQRAGCQSSLLLCLADGAGTKRSISIA